MKYRPEIDGLRMIAVMAVIIYHAEFAWKDGFLLEGGFFGVDVFFVISGFLITTLIINEYQTTNRFSLKRFYERRARRILPALFTVMLVSLPFGWIYLLPDQLTDLAKSQIASLLFGSNFYWLKSLQEYGAESGLLKPFLHTWSLAIEEQFYIFFPLLFVSIYRWRKNRYTITILSTGFLISLFIAEWLTPRNPSASFYMLYSRLWELLAGGIAANILYFHPQKSKDTLLNKIMPVIGLFLIGYAISLTNLNLSNYNHPGFITLLPVVGTILIIQFANGKDLISRLLATGLFVSIGLISYSLYLWHYPIFAFGRVLDSSPTTSIKLGWIFLTFILSLASYFLIEQPFRNKKVVSLRTLIVSTSLSLVVIGGISLYWLQNDGFKNRLGYLDAVIEPAKPIWVRLNGKDCHSGGAGGRSKFDIWDSCIFDYYPGHKYLVSIGDSHAARLSEDLRLLAIENELNFIEITEGGCPHILGEEGGVRHCQDRASQVLSFLKEFPNAIIVYSARIPAYMEQSRFDNEEGDQEANYIFVDEDKIIKGYPKRANALLETLNGWKNAGHTLVIVYPVPEQGFRVDSKLFAIRPIIQSESQLPDLSTSYKIYNERTKSSFDVLDLIAGDNVFRVYPDKLFCDEKTGRCYASRGSQIYFSSDNHVSPLGSRLIVIQVAEELELKIPDWDD